MSKLAKFSDAAIQVFKCFWPDEAVPERVDDICARLKKCGATLHEWRCSAARSGVDTTLRFVCSWYEDLDLDALETMRFGAPTDTDPTLTAKRRDRAYKVAHYASVSTSYRAQKTLKMLRATMKLKSLLKKLQLLTTNQPHLAKLRKAPLRNIHCKLCPCLKNNS
jgi:hypothetical protein